MERKSRKNKNSVEGEERNLPNNPIINKFSSQNCKNYEFAYFENQYK